jgi:hypothetical protein
MSARALAYLREVRRRGCLGGREGRDNPILQALAAWTLESVQGADATTGAIVHHLERTHCATGNAPPGLIYSRDIAAKVPAWFWAVDDALDAYADETGQPWAPRNGLLNIGSLVWFAVEWWASRLACALESHVQRGAGGAA